MARSAANDPLEKFRFLVDVIFNSSGGPASFARLGFHDVQSPKRSTNKIMYREGHNPDISSATPGLNVMEDVVMSRGVMANESNSSDFYRWVASVHLPTSGISSLTGGGASSEASTSGKSEFRAEVVVTMVNRSGEKVRAWKLYNAWPTHYVPSSDLNAAEDGEKAMESLTLAYEDFQEMPVASGSVSSVGSDPNA